MQTETQMLAQLLSLSGLMAGTIVYAEIVKRRAASRADAALREEGADIGLRGLVRVLLVDGQRTPTE
jgi:hypothetical protein